MTTGIDNDQLCTLVLDWAKKERPDAYEKTLAVAAIPVTFRRYLLRLVELRWEAEPGWRGSVPVLVLDETSITKKVKVGVIGETLEYKGQLSEPPIENRWWELGQSRKDYLTFHSMKKELDLEYVND